MDTPRRSARLKKLRETSPQWPNIDIFEKPQKKRRGSSEKQDASHTAPAKMRQFEFLKPSMADRLLVIPIANPSRHVEGVPSKLGALDHFSSCIGSVNLVFCVFSTSARATSLLATKPALTTGNKKYFALRIQQPCVLINALRNADWRTVYPAFMELSSEAERLSLVDGIYPCPAAALQGDKLFLNESSPEKLSSHALISAELAQRICEARDVRPFVHWGEVTKRVRDLPKNFESKVRADVELTSRRAFSDLIEKCAGVVVYFSNKTNRHIKPPKGFSDPRYDVSNTYHMQQQGLMGGFDDDEGDGDAWPAGWDGMPSVSDDEDDDEDGEAFMCDDAPNVSVIYDTRTKADVIRRVKALRPHVCKMLTRLRRISDGALVPCYATAQVHALADGDFIIYTAGHCIMKPGHRYVDAWLWPQYDGDVLLKGRDIADSVHFINYRETVELMSLEASGKYDVFAQNDNAKYTSDVAAYDYAFARFTQRVGSQYAKLFRNAKYRLYDGNVENLKDEPITAEGYSKSVPDGTREFGQLRRRTKMDQKCSQFITASTGTISSIVSSNAGHAVGLGRIWIQEGHSGGFVYKNTDVEEKEQCAEVIGLVSGMRPIKRLMREGVHAVSESYLCLLSRTFHAERRAYIDDKPERT